MVQINVELYHEVLQDFLDGLAAEQTKEQSRRKIDDTAKRNSGKEATG